jgi:hypothetical protein
MTKQGAIVLAVNIGLSSLNAVFWALITYLLNSSIWWLFGLIAFAFSFVGIACAQVSSEASQRAGR